MKTKSEVPHIFASFKAQIENLLGTTIKILLSDGGTEFKPILKQFPHLVHQTSCPYTPEQNGVAERKYRHLVELSLASMSHASIPLEYWDEIFSSTAYLINRIPSHNNQIPFPILFHKKPDYSMLRVLGCLCFPYTRPYNQHKLQLRALPCIFLGYASTQKGYRCLHLPTNKVYISRNVQFVETIFPFHSQSNSANTLSEPPTDSHLQLFLLEQPNSAHYISSHAQPNSVSHTSLSQPIISIPQYTPFASNPDLPSVSPTDSSSSSPPISNSPNSQLIPHVTPLPSSSHISTHLMITRTRDNTRKPRTFPHHVALTVSLEADPTTFSQAHSHPHWVEAMQCEIDALHQNRSTD